MSGDEERVCVPREIVDDLEAVHWEARRRLACYRNHVPAEVGDPEVVQWIRTHPALFVRGVFRGFDAEE